MQDTGRYPEIDTARGIAILMMVVFHTLFDLNYFSIAPVNVSTGFWRMFAYATASLFLFIAGLSLSISHARAARTLSGFAMAKKFLFRGAGIFACGLLITVVTWWFLGDNCIVFGILHLIGVSVMISPLFFRFKKWNAVIGLWVIAAGFYVATLTGPYVLLPFGIHPAAFSSVDYTPLLPWFGLVLIGIAAGEWLYPGGTRIFATPKIPGILEKPVVFLGRHSLVIYLIHQPIIIMLLMALTGKILL